MCKVRRLHLKNKTCVVQTFAVTAQVKPSKTYQDFDPDGSDCKVTL